jgi:predicted nucleotidyltransferase
MATIADSFRILLSDLAPSDGSIDAAEGHIASIRARLEKHFDLSKTMRVGSYSRDTFLEGKSDVDMLAVVRRDDIRWGDDYTSSTTVLDRVREALEGRYRTTHIRRDAQAVVVNFSDNRVDIVPAVFARWSESKHPVYEIPNGTGGWMETSPTLHNAYLRRADTTAGGKLRGTARLLKFWRHCRSPEIPLSSFYIEMVLAADGVCPIGKSYAWCVANAFGTLARRECRAIRDPKGISGLIPGVKTDAQRVLALNAVRYARDHALAALKARRDDDIDEARRQWDLVFNSEFPW